MLDAKNLTTISGNLVADPEMPSDSIITGSIAVSYGGTEDGKSATGFFDFKMFSSAPNFDFVKSQIKDKKMQKGSSLSIIGSLKQERYQTKDGQKASKIRIYAESISYGFSSGNKTSDDFTAKDAAHVASVPDGW